MGLGSEKLTPVPGSMGQKKKGIGSRIRNTVAGETDIHDTAA